MNLQINQADRISGIIQLVGGEKPIHKDALMDALGDELRRWGDVRPLPLTPDHPWAGPWTFNKILYDDIQTKAKALQKGLNDFSWAGCLGESKLIADIKAIL